MNEPLSNLDNACPHCGASDNEPDARFCQACGLKLGATLVMPTPPPTPCEIGKLIAGRFVIQSLLWTAPTYNAYAATAQGEKDSGYTIIERRLIENDPLAELSPVSQQAASTTGAKTKVSGNL